MAHIVAHVKTGAFLCLTLTTTLAAALLALGGCGSGSSAPSGPTSITPAQAASAATQVEQTLVAAVDQMTSEVCPLPPCCNINTEGFCALPVASEITCSGGGTVAYNGSLGGEMNFYGTGNTSGSLTFAPASCSIPSSTLVMDGIPSLVLNSQVSFFYAQPSSVTATATGPISYGPKPSGTCQANLTITAVMDTDGGHTLQSCTMTGTACGQTINQNCD